MGRWGQSHRLNNTVCSLMSFHIPPITPNAFSHTTLGAHTHKVGRFLFRTLHSSWERWQCQQLSESIPAMSLCGKCCRTEACQEAPDLQAEPKAQLLKASRPLQQLLRRVGCMQLLSPISISSPLFAMSARDGLHAHSILSVHFPTVHRVNNAHPEIERKFSESKA